MLSAEGMQSQPVSAAFGIQNHQACTHFEVKCRYRSEPDEVSLGGSSDPLKCPSSGAAVELPSNTVRKSTFASVSYSVKVNV